MTARILIVDDESSIRVTFREFLRDADYQVDAAEDADEALHMMAIERFDVVVTDIIMPQITGVALLKAIKEASPHVQVVLMTGEPTVETSSEAVREGACDYLSKPIGKEQLLKSVANATRIKALDDERRRLLVRIQALEQATTTILGELAKLKQTVEALADSTYVEPEPPAADAADAADGVETSVDEERPKARARDAWRRMWMCRSALVAMLRLPHRRHPVSWPVSAASEA